MDKFPKTGYRAIDGIIIMDSRDGDTLGKNEHILTDTEKTYDFLKELLEHTTELPVYMLYRERIIQSRSDELTQYLSKSKIPIILVQRPFVTPPEEFDRMVKHVYELTQSLSQSDQNLASGQGTEGFVETIRLQNVVTGEPFELHKVKSREWHRYNLWENGQGLKNTNFFFHERDDAICVIVIFVGGFCNKGSYELTSRGIGRTVLEYIKHYALGKNKDIIVTKTKNYGLIRLCSKYLSSKAIYRVNGEDKNFEEVNWLEELGAVTIEISDKEKLIWSGKFGKDGTSGGMKLLEYKCNDVKAKDFAENIIVIDNNGVVELQWKDSYKPNTEIYFQVELAVELPWIKISVEDLVATQVQKIPSRVLRREI